MRHHLTAALLLLAAAGVGTTHAAIAAPVLDDPTRPSDGHGARAVPGWPQLQVQGIVCHGDRRIAIIDGRVMHSGDRVGDVVIGEIRPDAVHYLRGGHELVAYLTKSTFQVRRPSASPKDSP